MVGVRGIAAKRQPKAVLPGALAVTGPLVAPLSGEHRHDLVRERRRGIAGGQGNPHGDLVPETGVLGNQRRLAGPQAGDRAAQNTGDLGIRRSPGGERGHIARRAVGGNPGRQELVGLCPVIQHDRGRLNDQSRCLGTNRKRQNEQGESGAKHAEKPLNGVRRSF